MPKISNKVSMSQYLYAVIPYNSYYDFKPDEYGEIGICYPHIPEFNGLKSELADPEGLTIYKGFLLVNTCYRMNSLISERNGFCWLRAEVYKLAQALSAKEVWYIEELCTDYMTDADFDFEIWKLNRQESEEPRTVEINLETLKENEYGSYNHDSFSDIVLEKK